LSAIESPPPVGDHSPSSAATEDLEISIALQLESELDEDLGRGREVVYHDADVLHGSCSRRRRRRDPTLT